MKIDINRSDRALSLTGILFGGFIGGLLVLSILPARAGQISQRDIAELASASNNGNSHRRLLQDGFSACQSATKPASKKPAQKSTQNSGASKRTSAPVTKPAPAPAEAPGAPKSYTETLPMSAVKVDMVGIPGGTITIRGKAVTVKPFWIGSTETSWEMYDTFIASGPASPAYDQTAFPADAIARPSKSYILPDLGWGHHGYPAINISILSATMYCRWLSKVTGKTYRLPTEAEWEMAARAGSPLPAKMAAAQLDKVAWYAGNSDGKSHPVGKKAPNAWKLYDMYGNVGEWATDLDGKPVLCGTTFLDAAAKVPSAAARQYQTPAWQETDPQLPKSRWWLSDGKFCGFRVVCEQPADAAAPVK